MLFCRNQAFNDTLSQGDLFDTRLPIGPGNQPPRHFPTHRGDEGDLSEDEDDDEDDDEDEDDDITQGTNDASDTESDNDEIEDNPFDCDGDNSTDGSFSDDEENSESDQMEPNFATSTPIGQPSTSQQFQPQFSGSNQQRSNQSARQTHTMVPFIEMGIPRLRNFSSRACWAIAVLKVCNMKQD